MRYVRLIVSVVALLVATVGLTGVAKAECPKLLFFDGLDIRKPEKELTTEEARYWGKTVGIDGFFVSHLFDAWQVPVGSDEDSQPYMVARRFQEIYSAEGVTDNFLTVALGWDAGTKPRNVNPNFWNEPALQNTVVRNFRDAAHLARFARFKGMALDLEPYGGGPWQPDPTDPGRPAKIQNFAARVGREIATECPECLVATIPEALGYAVMPIPKHTALPQKWFNRYRMSQYFIRGLVSGGIKHLVVATETSYTAPDPTLALRNAHPLYERLRNIWGDLTISYALGLWPLGKSYTNKAAHETPENFKRRLEAAMAAGQPYVWIYGHGSAWEAEGPYGSGPVVPNFSRYTAVVHEVKKECRQGFLNPTR